MWHARCRTGKSLSGDPGLHGPLKNGKFHAHGTLRATGLGTINGAPVTARETLTITFTVRGRKATGSLTVNAIVFAGKKKIDTCATGQIHFVAKR